MQFVRSHLLTIIPTPFQIFEGLPPLYHNQSKDCKPCKVRIYLLNLYTYIINYFQPFVKCFRAIILWIWYNEEMDWTLGLIVYWIEHYYELRNYELLPFENLFTIKGLPILAGSHINQSPYEETCDLNWEFDKALTKLGERGKLFREVYLDGQDETDESRKVYDEFCNILIGGNDGNR